MFAILPHPKLQINLSSPCSHQQIGDMIMVQLLNFIWDDSFSNQSCPNCFKNTDALQLTCLQQQLLDLIVQMDHINQA